tara:strand:- start:160 stop:363 length:204 start_codon:yes stop_codon:yes gene_type:complete
MKETIKFTIAQDGTVTEEILGVYGDACEQLTSDIEESLGTVYFKENTSDYYTQNNVALQHNQNQIKM